MKELFTRLSRIEEHQIRNSQVIAALTVAVNALAAGTPTVDSTQFCVPLPCQTQESLQQLLDEVMVDSHKKNHLVNITM
jgi:hypothetical protein